MSNNDLQNNAEDENLSVGDVQIRQMIKNLQRVDAPKDFDFRLKARIANAKPTEFQPRFLPVLRYVLPFSVVVLIFTFITVSGVYFAGNEQTAVNVQLIPVETEIAPANNLQIVLPEVEKVQDKATLQTNSMVSTQPVTGINKRETTPTENNQLIAVKPKKPQSELLEENITEDGSGSRVLGLDVKPKVFTPKGIPNEDLVENSPNNENKNDIITRQILLPLGVEIVSENGNRRVLSVKKDSVAGRAGLKVGDLVEAIDGEKVSGNAVRGTTLQGKKMTVLRGTEIIEINLLQP